MHIFFCQTKSCVIFFINTNLWMLEKQKHTCGLWIFVDGIWHCCYHEIWFIFCQILFCCSFFFLLTFCIVILYTFHFFIFFFCFYLFIKLLCGLCMFEFVKICEIVYFLCVQYIVAFPMTWACAFFFVRNKN